jgi:hypothetical protein
LKKKKERNVPPDQLFLLSVVVGASWDVRKAWGTLGWPPVSWTIYKDRIVDGVVAHFPLPSATSFSFFFLETCTDR